MINISGKLVIRASNERNGESSKEGLLKCSLGRFRIKYFQLGTLNLGEYEGFFTMTKIEPYCHSHQGKFLLELEAVIEKMAFTSQPEGEVSQQKHLLQRSLLSELDNSTDTNPQIEVSVNSQEFHEVSVSLNEDQKLFGSLFPLDDEIELDVSQDRSILRQQVSRLKQIGYRFDEKSQQWVLPYLDQAAA